MTVTLGPLPVPKSQCAITGQVMYNLHEPHIHFPDKSIQAGLLPFRIDILSVEI